MSRSRSNHEPRPRNRGIGNRPKLWLEITTVVLESTDPRGKGRAKLQRFSDGSLRILLLDQMGRAATHGYDVCVFGETIEYVLLTTTGETSEAYLVPATAWDAVLCGTGERAP